MLRVAVTFADWAVVMVPAVAEKVAVVAPAATIAEAGTVSRVLLSDTITVVPPLGAAWFNVAVQVAAVPEFKLVGEQVRPVSRTTGCSEIAAEKELVPRVTVMLAD